MRAVYHVIAVTSERKTHERGNVMFPIQYLEKRVHCCCNNIALSFRAASAWMGNNCKQTSALYNTGRTLHTLARAHYLLLQHSTGTDFRWPRGRPVGRGGKITPFQQETPKIVIPLSNARGEGSPQINGSEGRHWTPYSQNVHQARTSCLTCTDYLSVDSFVHRRCRLLPPPPPPIGA